MVFDCSSGRVLMRTTYSQMSVLAGQEVSAMPEFWLIPLSIEKQKRSKFFVVRQSLIEEWIFQFSLLMILRIH